MSESEKIIYSAIATLIGGIFLLLLGQGATKLFIEPLQELRKIIGEIAFNLIYYANVISNPDIMPPEELSEATKKFRELASNLKATSYTLYSYWICSFLRLIPNRRSVNKASTLLIRLSNTSKRTTPSRIDNDLKKIKRLLLM